MNRRCCLRDDGGWRSILRQRGDSAPLWCNRLLFKEASNKPIRLETTCDWCDFRKKHFQDSMRGSELGFSTASLAAMNEEAVRFWADVEREGAIFRAVEAESDRGVAVLVATLLEERLVRAIEARLGHLPQVTLRSRKADTFAARIRTANEIGIFREETLNNLTIIRSVRNMFAHELTGADSRPLTFSSTEIAVLCAALTLPQCSRPLSARKRFVGACVGHAYELDLFARANRDFDAADLFRLP